MPEVPLVEFPLPRRKTRAIRVGAVEVGGDAPISVQSMCNTDTCDADATTAQIKRLENAGCEIVRAAVPNREAADALRRILPEIKIPLIADIHFDYRLALAAVEAGVEGLRINPGNIGAEWKVAEVVRAAGERKIPIRIGVNSGSLDKETLRRHGGPTPEALVESALGHIAIVEKLGYSEIKVSLKGSHIPQTVKAYQLLAEKCDYPFHVGITEAGSVFRGAVKSAVGLGILFYLGLGDTVRVSLTGDPVKEVEAAFHILRAMGLREKGLEIISCPTCGRTKISLIKLVEEVEQRLSGVSAPLTVAVMGCEVNGPGEAREADVGLAGGRNGGVLFKNGETVRRVAEDDMADALVSEVMSMVRDL